MTDAELLRELDQEAESLTRCEDVRAGELYAKAAARLRELIGQPVPLSDWQKLERERDKWKRNAEDWARLYDTEAIKREKYAGERDKLRKDAERWRHFRDNMDHCDALHMLANGTDHYDATIDAALAPEQGKDDDDTLPTPQELAAVKTEKRWPVWIEGYRATGEEATASYKGEWPGETFPDACEAWAKADPRRLADFKRLYRPGDGPRYWGCRMFDNERDARRSFG